MMRNNSPGKHIREQALDRQALAMQRYAGAVGAVVGVILLFLLLRLSGIGIFLYAAGLVGAYYLYRDGQHLMKRADDAFRGEAAERQVALELEPLKRRNWEVKHNVKLKKWGDADIVLRSPKDNWYVVDVKSHNGTKIYQNGRLLKRFGRNTYELREGDLISKVKGQAASIASIKQVTWVTPILCFTNGNIDIPNNIALGVHIIMASELISTLIRLDG